MPAIGRLYATRSSANSAVTLYNALAEELAAETSASTVPVPRRSKRIKPEDDDGVYPTNSSVGDSRLAAQESGRPAKRVNVERVTDADAEDEGVTPKPKRRLESSRRKAPKKQKPIRQSLDKPHPAPELWREQYDAIKSMRARVKAPVDTMGCDQAQNGETDPKVLIHRQGSHLIT
jgi:endonuclease III